MSRHLILTSAILTGMSLVVGCGTKPTGSTATPSSSGRSGNLSDDIKRKAEDVGKKTTEATNTLTGKAKDLYDEASKEIEVVKKKIEELKKKASEGGDAGPRAEAAKMLNIAEPKLKEVMALITNSFSPEKFKELGSDEEVAKLKDVLMKAIGELKKSVGL